MLEVSKWLNTLLPRTTKELHQHFLDMIQKTLKSIYLNNGFKGQQDCYISKKEKQYQQQQETNEAI